MTIHEGPSPFVGASPVAPLSQADGVVTLVDGQTFCLSGRTGDMAADLPHGLFLFDTRVLSRWELRINGHRLEPLTVDVTEPFSATFVGRTAPEKGQADADIVAFRRRHIGAGMRERIEVTNHGTTPVHLTIELGCDADFADLFAVKESRVRRRGRHVVEPDELVLRFGHEHNGRAKQVAIRPSPPAAVEPGLLHWQVTLAPKERWETCIELSVTLGTTPVPPRFRCDGADGATPPEHIASWHTRVPTIDTDDPALTMTLARSIEDIGALRIFDPEHPGQPILAAGAPWFMTVFGRDSLLTGWMTLIADPSLAHGVLETLARFQGTDVDPPTEEQPGKILHEMRFGGTGSLALGGGQVYYGSIDATPLFVMLLAELSRWDPGDDIVDRLLPHADRALAWVRDFGDPDGDGYVEYQRITERGLANQGWKDSWDSMRFADGRLAETPIALCEVQGYVYAAYRARAELATSRGDAVTATHFETAARDLKRRFNEDFWIPERGWFALGLDRDDRPIDALASNMGHCLWTGIVDDELAPLVADRLLAHDLFSGFGIRTLATSMAGYNPVSYHNGSVWPHDNALCIAGLVRYGLHDHAHRVIRAQLDASVTHHGRLPELFAGFDRRELSIPASYPTSCSPQAWAAASPLLWLRSLLGFDPSAAEGRIRIDPSLPTGIGCLRVSGIRIGNRRMSVTVENGSVSVEGAEGLDVERSSRTIRS